MPHFTLVGATTRTGLLTGPLRDRFGISYRLDYYTPAELSVIVGRSARILGVGIDARGAAEIASRSRGTPRLANRLLKRVRDYAQVKREGTITGEVAAEALEFFEIDALGLDTMDVRILTRALRDLPRPPGGAHHRRERRLGGPLPRSRTSTSRTCCSAASSYAHRRVARPRSRPSTTWGWSRPPARGASFSPRTPCVWDMIGDVKLQASHLPFRSKGEP